jgi:hypothetical protein
MPAVVVLGLVAHLPGGPSYTVAISDQQASTFRNPLFAPLRIHAARHIAPYDAMRSPADRLELDGWLRAARAAGVRVLISFEHSHRPGRERYLPLPREYARAVEEFHRAYPWVTEVSPWNEVNRCVAPEGPVTGQPTCGQERRLATYYAIARRVFGPRTTVVALDVLDAQDVSLTLETIRRFLRYARPHPRILGLHNYSDTNRFSTDRTSQVVALWSGDVWLTETGGIVKLGDRWPFDEDRAARALGCMFTIAAQEPRVKRLYVYQFNGAPPEARFDAGLVDADGVTKRPGYDIVRRRRAGACIPQDPESAPAR